MSLFLKYLTAAASGVVGAFVTKKAGPEVGDYAGGLVGSAIALAAARLLHITPAPQK